MSISIDSAYQSMLTGLGNDANKTNSDARTSALESKLTSLQSGASEVTDKELMDVAKSFESYLIEQVLKSTKEALAPTDEDDNPYISTFSDSMYQAYAEQITENGEIGLAKQLYEAMKKDYKI